MPLQDFLSPKLRKTSPRKRSDLAFGRVLFTAVLFFCLKPDGRNHRYFHGPSCHRTQAQAPTESGNHGARGRLNGLRNEPMGIVSIQEGPTHGGRMDVDLVEIAAPANPPVCRLMDYEVQVPGAEKAHDAKAAEADRGQGSQIPSRHRRGRLSSRCATCAASSPRTATRARSRCGSGAARSPPGHRSATAGRIRDELADVAMVEHMPKLEGRQMIMVLAPKRRSEGLQFGRWVWSNPPDHKSRRELTKRFSVGPSSVPGLQTPPQGTQRRRSITCPR